MAFYLDLFFATCMAGIFTCHSTVRDEDRQNILSGSLKLAHEPLRPEEDDQQVNGEDHDVLESWGDEQAAQVSIASYEGAASTETAGVQ